MRSVRSSPDFGSTSRGYLPCDQTNRRPRNAEPDFELGAHRHPLEPLTEYVGEIAVTLVAAVETDLGAEQARGDPEPDRLVVVPLRQDGWCFADLFM